MGCLGRTGTGHRRPPPGSLDRGVKTMPENEHDWQRTTEHPTASALVSFLEADLDRGMRLAWRAETQWESERRIDPALAGEMEAVDTEIRRWLGRAAIRRIPTARLQSRVGQFHAALANVRRWISGET